LQWGHNLPAVEIWADRAAGLHVHQASMGPRPSSRGNWQPAPRLLAGRQASMGPRPSSRGNLAAAANIGDTNMLQLGPDLPAVETCAGSRRVCPGGRASMMPRPRSRGNASTSTLAANMLGSFNGATAGLPWKL